MYKVKNRSFGICNMYSGGSSTRPGWLKGSLARRVKPKRLARPGKMEITTSTVIAKNGLYMQGMYEYTSSMSVC